MKIISLGEPNYGKALKQGILLARGDIVLCDEIDLCDADFHKRAVDILETGEADLVIGSKLAVGAADERPLIRHAASIAYSTLLKVLLGFRGTDTHGLKAFRRLALLDVVRACLVDKDVFASEFVIRADRAGIVIKEVPGARHREAPAEHQPLQARAERDEEPRQAHLVDPHSRVGAASNSGTADGRRAHETNAA